MTENTKSLLGMVAVNRAWLSTMCSELDTELTGHIKRLKEIEEARSFILKNSWRQSKFLFLNWRSYFYDTDDIFGRWDDALKQAETCREFFDERRNHIRHMLNMCGLEDANDFTEVYITDQMTRNMVYPYADTVKDVIDQCALIPRTFTLDDDKREEAEKMLGQEVLPNF